MSQEKIFAEGFIVKRKDNAPEFVIANVSVKVSEAIAFLKNHEKNGWVNLGIKKARSGSMYMELDTFEPRKTDAPTPAPQPEPERREAPKPKAKVEDDDLPF
jgi:hypothetical protein